MLSGTVTDAAGNSATTTQTVTVIDEEDPTITAPVNVTVPTDAGVSTATGVVLGTPTIADNVGANPATNDSTEPYSLGDNFVIWTVTDAAGNSATTTQTVTVIDEEDPTITAPVNVTVPTDAGVSTATGVVLGTPTIADNVGANPATNDSTEPYSLGDNFVIWTVTDAAGNSATTTQTVTVIDEEDPTITAPDDQIFEATAVDTPLTSTDYGIATATDNVDPNPVITNDAPSTFSLGDTTFTWTATDANNNISTATQTITILNAPPVGVSDVYSVNEDTILTVSDYASGVLGNDLDPNDLIIASSDLITEPTNGILLLNIDGTFEYDPDEDFFGIDTFTYIPNDGFLVGSETSVTINIQPINDVPVAGDATAPTALNTDVEILLTGSDIDGDNLGLNLISLPSNGAITEIIEVSSNSISLKYEPKCWIYRN